MQLNSRDLVSHIKSNLAFVYLFHGTEPLLVEDSANRLRKAAKSQGFDERIVFTMEIGFDWSRFISEFDCLSLFSRKKIIELRLPGGKPGTKGAELLINLMAHQNEDTCLLILCEKLEPGTKNSKWFKLIAQTGIVIEHYSVATGQLLSWIKQRATLYKLSINDDACRLLAYYLEGNLLAIDQELRKFSLLISDRSISLNDVQQCVEDGARFTVYSFVDATLSGNLKRSLRMLASLRAEGVEPVLINWAIARETRNLLEMSSKVANGQSIHSVIKQHRIWSNRAGIVESALKRLKLSDCRMIHRCAAELDRYTKGRESSIDKAGIWTEYERMASRLCKVN